MVQKSSKLIAETKYKKTYEITYHCNHCGYTWIERKEVDNDGGFGSFGGGLIIGSMLGRGLGGRGGGFGGGGFGGGGASGSW